MSTSPIVTEQLHTQKTTPMPAHAQQKTEPPMLKTRIWHSVDLPSLSLSDPVGTTTKMPMASSTHAQALKNSDPVSTPTTSPQRPVEPLDPALEARMAQLRATTLALRDDVDDVRRNTGKLS
jgi:hypothetical protein